MELKASEWKNDVTSANFVLYCCRSNGGAVTMLQITEDTPADMLAGAMDLTVHLPNGRAVKMSVKRR